MCLVNVRLDLDGVLVDICTAIWNRLGVDDPYLLRDNRGRYSLTDVLGIPASAIWTPMHDPTAWSTAPWMPDGRAIWENLVLAVGLSNITIVSKLCPHYSMGEHIGASGRCAQGKVEWIERNLGTDVRYQLSNKSEARVEGMSEWSVLIDDCDDNVSACLDGNRSAITVPRPWNSLHRRSHEAVEYVMDEYRKVVSDAQSVEEDDVWG